MIGLTLIFFIVVYLKHTQEIYRHPYPGPFLQPLLHKTRGQLFATGPLAATMQPREGRGWEHHPPSPGAGCGGAAPSVAEGGPCGSGVDTGAPCIGWFQADGGCGDYGGACIHRRGCGGAGLVMVVLFSSVVVVVVPG